MLAEKARGDIEAKLERGEADLLKKNYSIRNFLDEYPKRTRGGEQTMVRQIKEFIEWNNDPVAATMLLSSIEDIADPAHLELWRNTKNRWDSQ